VAATESRAPGARLARRLGGRAGALATRLFGAMGGVLATGHAEAADLPEDSAELMYHSYIGGGVVANGPALLAQKSVGDEISFSASYYVDMVSNASIDVVTTASPYRERRDETGVGAQVLHRESLVSVGATRSTEPDYIADSASIDVSQELLDGMTTLKIGYTRGWDTVMKHGDPSFSQPADHWQYRLGLTQVITPRWLASLNTEAISDAGFLSSPYRAARVFGTDVPEVDPPTRTSRAATLRAVGAVGESGAVRASFRYFWDTWDIRARTLEAGYAQHLGPRWTVDGNLRYYWQEHASFYSDDFAAPMTYMSRNRQLSTFHDLGAGAKATFSAYRVPAVMEVKLSAAYERLQYHYDDFTDLRPGANGRLYSSGANVVEIFVTGTF
jgi:hypothetical protein